MDPVVQVPADPKECNPSSASVPPDPKSIQSDAGGPPPLPGDKSFLFNGLRAVVACKYVITKGLLLNFGKQTS